MNKTNLPNFNLEATLLGGQAFNFDFDIVENCFFGFTQDKVIKLKKEGNSLYWQTYPKNDDFDFIKNYLRLDVDYEKILKHIQKDKHIISAVKKYPNLRLLKQDFEQTLLSFMLSTNNNISSIRRLIRTMNQKFGKAININCKKIFLFPETKVIANAPLDELLKCKLGFRAKFLKAAAQRLLKTNLSNKIYNLKENDLRKNLAKIKGIGDKITDCILAFSLGFDNITPLDIWAKRALIKFYKLNPKMKYNQMSNWVSNYFERYTSWAGQFLYEYVRNG